MPRRARHLIPTQLPRRGEVIAACAVLIVLAHVLFAQLTFVLAVTFAVVGKASRWRGWWLAVPAAAGLAWMLAIGPRAAAAGFAAGSAQILGYLGQGGHPLSRLLAPRGAFAGAGSWLPRQLPLALVIGAAEAALAAWVAWIHTDEWAVPARRPGAFAAIRSALNRRAIGSGAVVARDGCALGVDPATGAKVVLGWPEVAGGTLVTGAPMELVTITSFQVVKAALRRRKPVIVIDMTGDPAVGRALAGACATAGSELWVYRSGQGRYEPFRHATAARRLAMTLALLGADEADRPLEGVRAYLRTVFAVMEAVPADPRIPVLDDVVHLLNPLALQARLRLVPAADQRRGELDELALAAAVTAQPDPKVLQAAGQQLTAVRRPAGSGAADGGIDLLAVVRERSAALFSVNDPAMARLVLADVAALGEDLRRIGVDGDGLVWLHGADSLAAATLGRLVTGGAAAGLPVLVSVNERAAPDIASLVNAVLMHRLADAATAASLAPRTGSTLSPASPAGGEGGELVPRPAVPAQALLSLGPGRFALVANSPRYRLVRLGQLVPARLPRGPEL
jgi:hypothetical protein